MKKVSSNEELAKGYLLENLTLFDDIIFRQKAENVEFITELLRVLLEDDKLKVLKVEPQKDYRFYQQRGVILDVLCEISNKKLINVEVEKNSDDIDDDQRKVRYYSSVINVKNLYPGMKFRELPDLVSLYLTKKDNFGLGMTTYHIDRCIRGTNKTVSNGYHEIYINAEVDDKTKIADYMKVLTSKDYVSDEFIATSKVKEELDMPVEVQKAFESIRQECESKGRQEGLQRGRQEGKIEGRQEGKIETYNNLINLGLISEEVALSNLKLSKEEFDNKVRELGI